MKRLAVLLVLSLSVVACGGSSSSPASPSQPPAATPTRVIAITGNLAFGNVQVGTTTTATLTIANSGTASLTVSAIAYPTGFNGNWTSGTIAAGGSQNVTVTFSPTAATSYSGTVTVKCDSTSGANTIAVSGTGTAAPSETRVVSLTGDLAFGNVQVGASTTRTLTITNSGNGPLTVSSIVYPTVLNAFSGNWAGGTIPPGGSHAVTVTFLPLFVGIYSGVTTVVCDSTSGINTIQTSGTGTAVPVPPPAGSDHGAVNITGNTNFGNVQVGASASATVTLTNAGTVPVTVTNMIYPKDFSGNWPGGTISVGGSQKVTITFSPTVVQAYREELRVTYNDPLTLGTHAPLDGNGVPVPIALSGSLAFGNVKVGGTASATLTIRNVGVAPTTVTAAFCFDEGFSVDPSGLPAVIRVGGSLDLTVWFLPTAIRDYNGTVYVRSAGWEDPNAYRIAVSGTGVGGES